MNKLTIKSLHLDVPVTLTLEGDDALLFIEYQHAMFAFSTSGRGGINNRSLIGRVNRAAGLLWNAFQCNKHYYRTDWRVEEVA